MGQRNPRAGMGRCYQPPERVWVGTGFARVLWEIRGRGWGTLDGRKCREPPSPHTPCGPAFHILHLLTPHTVLLSPGCPTRAPEVETEAQRGTVLYLESHSQKVEGRGGLGLEPGCARGAWPHAGTQRRGLTNPSACAPAPTTGAQGGGARRPSRRGLPHPYLVPIPVPGHCGQRWYIGPSRTESGHRPPAASTQNQGWPRRGTEGHPG